MTVLPNLQQQTQMQAARIAELEAQLAAASKPKAITLKVTAPKLDEKSGQMVGTSGAISIYGLGRFPITLYRSQLERLIAEVPTIKAFIAANSAMLATK
jgi:hypothetical protein